MSESGQQQPQPQRPQQQPQQQQPQAQQQQPQQQQLSPEQRLARAVQGIRQVQNWMELNYPQHSQAVQILREAGDLVGGELQRSQQQQQQQGS